MGSSSTVHAPRNLSQTLLRRLEEIAQGSGGKLLLHSRLFAQWMHQAFPRECPYPNLAGTVTSLSPNEWKTTTGIQHRIDHAGRKSRRNATLRHINELEKKHNQRVNDEINAVSDVDKADLQWTYEDEHLVEPSRQLL